MLWPGSLPLTGAAILPPSTLRFLDTLLVAIRGVTQGIRKNIFEDMFRLGAVSKLCILLDHPQCSEVSARILGWITSVPSYRCVRRLPLFTSPPGPHWFPQQDLLPSLRNSRDRPLSTPTTPLPYLPLNPPPLPSPPLLAVPQAEAPGPGPHSHRGRGLPLQPAVALPRGRGPQPGSGRLASAGAPRLGHPRGHAGEHGSS